MTLKQVTENAVRYVNTLPTLEEVMKNIKRVLEVWHKQ